MTVLSRVFETVLSSYDAKYKTYIDIPKDVVDRMKIQIELVQTHTHHILKDLNVNNLNVVDNLFEGVFADYITYERIISFFTGAIFILTKSNDFNHHHFKKVIENIDKYLDPWFCMQRTWYYDKLWSEKKNRLFNKDFMRILIIFVSHRLLTFFMNKIYYWYLYFMSCYFSYYYIRQLCYLKTYSYLRQNK